MVTRRISVIFDSNTSSLVKGFKESAKAGKEAADSMGTLSDRIKDNEKTLTDAGKSLATFGTVGVGALVASGKAAVDWDSQWAGVTKTVDGTVEQMANLEGGLRDMARTMPATHEEIAAVAEAAGQLGVETESIESFTKTMIDLGETTNLTADEAATSIAQLMNVMQTAPGEVDNLGSALVALGNDGASTERQIVQMAQGMAGAAAIVGMSEADVLAVANAFASVGIEAEAGGTAFSRIITDMAKSVSTGSEELTTFAEVAGMSAQEFARAFEEDPTAAFDTFIQGLSRIQAAGGDVFTILEDLGMSDVRVSRALLGMATSGDLLTESIELGSDAWIKNTALTDEAEKRYETAAAQISVAWNNIRDAAISAGEVILPTVASISGVVADLAGAFSDLPDPIQGAIVGIGGVTSAAALLAGSALIMVPRIRDTVQAFRDLSRISPRVNSALGGVGKAAGIAGIALGGITIAASGLQPMWQGVADGANEAAEGLEAFLDGGSDAEGISRNMAAGLSDLEEAVNLVFNRSVLQNIGEFGAEIGTLGGVWGGTATDDAQAFFDELDSGLAKLVEGGKGEQAVEIMEMVREEAERQGVTAGQLADRMPSASAAIDGYQESLAAIDATEAADGTDEFADGLADVEQAAADAEQAMSDLRAEIEGWGSPLRDARSAARDFEQALDDIETAMGEDEWVATLDNSTEAGRRNQEMLDGLASDTLNYASAVAEAGGSTGELTQIMATGRAEFINAAEDMGMTRSEAESLADAMGLIPEEVAVTVKESGLEQFQEDVNSVTDWVSTLEARLNLGMDTTPADNKFDVWYTETDGAVATPTLDADNNPAIYESDEWKAYSDEMSARSTFDTDSSPAISATDAWWYKADNTYASATLDAWNGPAFSALNSFLNAIPRSVSVSIRAIPIVGNIFPFSDGGLIQYANGGFDDKGSYVSRVPQMAGPQFGKTNIMWGEESTGWEAYISGKPGMEERNKGILTEAAKRLGMEVIDNRLKQYENGHIQRFAQTPASAQTITLGEVITRLDPADRALIAALADRPQVLKVDSREVAYANRRGENSFGDPGTWSGAPRLGRK